MQNRGKDLPSHVELIVPDKVAVVALERIQDQGLVRVGDPRVCESLLPRQVELGLDRTGFESREFRVHLDVDCLVGLDTQDELVSGNVVEDATGHIFELHSNFHLALVEG